MVQSLFTQEMISINLIFRHLRYDKEQRSLPWRKSSRPDDPATEDDIGGTPYAVWVKISTLIVTAFTLGLTPPLNVHSSTTRQENQL